MNMKTIKKLLAGAGLALLSLGAIAQTNPSRLDEIIKTNKLRVCTPGDYKPFSLAKPDGSFEGLDIDLIQAAAKSLGVEVELIKSSWPKLLDDFVEKCDVAVGGISVSTDRAKRTGFMTAYMVNGKAPIARCEDKAKYQTVLDINKTTVTVITNPGGSNEKFVRANLPNAKVIVYNDNVTIFDQILQGKADVMISESVETIVQQKSKPGLCAINPDKPLQYGEMSFLLPRGDVAMKAFFDTWLHLSKESGEYKRILAKWVN
jgi:cyclohexadienyl dehydratase